MTACIRSVIATAGLSLLAVTFNANATGAATCESGPKNAWRPQEKLEKQLIDQHGWKIRRIKEDGGGYEM